MPDRSPEEREAARLERERRRAGREGRPAPEERKVLGDRDPKPCAPPPAAPPTEQYDVALEWAGEAPTVATTEREVPLGTRRVGAHERPRKGRPAQASAAPRPPRTTRRLLGRALALLAILLIALAAWFLVSLFQPFSGDGHGRVTVRIPRGATAGQVADLLQRDGVISSSFFFNLRAKLAGERGDIKSGTFALRSDMSYGAALSAITKSPPPPPTIHVTIPEGLSRREVAALVRRDGIKGDYLAASRRAPGFDPRRYGAPRGATLEGFLFPATYELRRGASAQDLVAQQLAAFKRNLAALDLRRAHAKNLTAFDVVTIAAMVEREVAVARERPLVAAVIYNRLHAGMTLGIDATIRYGLHVPGTESLKQSQLDSNNPYNTRKFAGLPPTPIGNPGLASMQAAAHPAKVAYLYFVRKPDRVHHYFTASFQDFVNHEIAYGYK